MDHTQYLARRLNGLVKRGHFTLEQAQAFMFAYSDDAAELEGIINRAESEELK